MHENKISGSCSNTSPQALSKKREVKSRSGSFNLCRGTGPIKLSASS